MNLMGIFQKSTMLIEAYMVLMMMVVEPLAI